MNHLPLEIISTIALHLNRHDIINYFKVNMYISQLLNDEYFWKVKLVNDYQIHGNYHYKSIYFTLSYYFINSRESPYLLKQLNNYGNYHLSIIFDSLLPINIFAYNYWDMGPFGTTQDEHVKCIMSDVFITKEQQYKMYHV